MNLSWTNLLPLLIILSSVIPGLIIFTLREDQVRLRVTLNLTGALLKLGLVALMLFGVSQGLEFRFSVPFLPGGGLCSLLPCLRCSGWQPPFTPLAIWKIRPCAHASLVISACASAPPSAWP